MLFAAPALVAASDAAAQETTVTRSSASAGSSQNARRRILRQLLPRSPQQAHRLPQQAQHLRQPAAENIRIRTQPLRQTPDGATVIYKAAPPSVVSLTADGYLIFKGKRAGKMTATVFAIAGTVTGGDFTPRPVKATGYRLLTLRGLDYCSVSKGCDAFGLENARTPEDRLSAFIAMNLSTVTMFANSGAQLNDYLSGMISIIRSTADGLTRTKRTYLAANLLYHLAAAKKPRHVFALVAAGANANLPDSKNNAPLHYAAQYGSIPALTILLQAGASINAKGEAKRTPLTRAALYGNITAVSKLLAAGANPNIESARKYLPLHYAAWNGKEKMAGALLAAGASPNAATDHGITPLHFAAQNGHGAVITLLAGKTKKTTIRVKGSNPYTLTVRDGAASINAFNIFQETPMDFAVRHKQTTAASLLAHRGGICSSYRNSGDPNCGVGFSVAFDLAVALGDLPMMHRLAIIGGIPVQKILIRHAVKQNNIAFLGNLIKRHGAANLLDKDGGTLLDWTVGEFGATSQVAVKLTASGARCNKSCVKNYARLDGQICDASFNNATRRAKGNVKVMPGVACTRGAFYDALTTGMNATVLAALNHGADADLVLPSKVARLQVGGVSVELSRSDKDTALDAYNEIFPGRSAEVLKILRARKVKCKNSCMPSDVRAPDGLVCYPEWSSAAAGKFQPASSCRDEEHFTNASFSARYVVKTIDGGRGGVVYGDRRETFTNKIIMNIFYSARRAHDEPIPGARVRRERAAHSHKMITAWMAVRPDDVNRYIDGATYLPIAAIWASDNVFDYFLNHPDMLINKTSPLHIIEIVYHGFVNATPWDHLSKAVIEEDRRDHPSISWETDRDVVFRPGAVPGNNRITALDELIRRINLMRNRGAGCHRGCGTNIFARNWAWPRELQTPKWLRGTDSGWCSIKSDPASSGFQNFLMSLITFGVVVCVTNPNDWGPMDYTGFNKELVERGFPPGGLGPPSRNCATPGDKACNPTGAKE